MARLMRALGVMGESHCGLVQMAPEGKYQNDLHFFTSMHLPFPDIYIYIYLAYFKLPPSSCTIGFLF